MIFVPHKFRILLELKRGKITVQEAAQALKTSERTTKQMLTLWSSRLYRVVPVVDALLLPKNTKSEQKYLKEKLVKLTNSTERQVNRLLILSDVAVPKPKSVVLRVEKRKTAEKNKELHRKHAIDVIAGLATAIDAADAAGVTKRHIYRLANSLCESVGVTFKDLRFVTQAQRQNVALQIEKLAKEGQKDERTTTPRRTRRNG